MNENQQNLINKYAKMTESHIRRSMTKNDLLFLSARLGMRLTSRYDKEQLAFLIKQHADFNQEGEIGDNIRAERKRAQLESDVDWRRESIKSDEAEILRLTRNIEITKAELNELLILNPELAREEQS